MGVSKYAWIGNRISEESMKRLYMMKQEIKKPITVMVAEAVNEYIEKRLTDEMQNKNKSEMKNDDLGSNFEGSRTFSAGI
jgi:hypothetical protein